MWRRAQPWKARISSKPAYFGWGALVGCGLTVLSLWAAGGFRKVGSWGEDKALVRILPPVRITEGRVDGQVKYARYPTPIDPKDSLWLRFRDEAGRLGRTDSPKSMRDAALADLLDRHLDQAIWDLRDTIRQNPDDERLLFSDLSALHGERGRRENRPEDFAAALEAALTAEAGPPNPETLFNLALSEERLFFYREARETWRSYLDLDESSRWAEEARAHLKTISSLLDRPPDADPRQLILQAIDQSDWQTISRLSAEWPQEAREVFDITLLSKWGEAVVRGEAAKADRRLKAARSIARARGRNSGDPFYSKLVEEMNAVRPGADKSVAKPLHDFRNALETVDKNADREFLLAEQGLRSVKSPAELLVRLQRAVWRYNQDDLSNALDILTQLDKDSRLASYPRLAARCQELLGDIWRRNDVPTEASAAYQRAAGLFEALGERQNHASVEMRLATTLDRLNLPGNGWQHRYKALTWANSATPGTERSDVPDVFEEAAFASLEQRRPRVALLLETRVLNIFERLSQPVEIVRTSLVRARIEAALGKPEEARRDFMLAVRTLDEVPLSARASLASRIDIARTEIEQSADRASIIVAYSKAPGRLGARADLDFRLGDTLAAEKDLQRSLRQIERHREEIRLGRDRVFLLDDAEPLYQRMVALQLHLAKPEKALEALEKFRARYLLDQAREGSGHGGGAGAPLTWQEIIKRIPEHTVVIAYAEVEGRLANFLASSSGISVSPYQPPWGATSDWARVLSSGKLGDDPSSRHTMEYLYRDLVGPWKNKLKPGDRIYFIPTQSLYGVPFAALHDPATGRFLIQDHEIGVAPSISELFAAIERDRRASTRPISSVLLVGNPTQGIRSKDSGLGDLPAATQEIERIGLIYQGLDVRKLTRETATPRRVRELLGSSDIAHFAVHALDGAGNPAHSRLVLSSDGSSPGDLLADDILRLDLSRTRLVMLAACDTHKGPLSASEGSQSLAYSFLAAGVPAVVGSLWPVDDSATERLSIRFHRQLQSGADAITALRAAQLEELATGPNRSGWTWASFQVFGGVVARRPTPAGSPTPTRTAP